MADPLSYTILVDNEAHGPGLITEHGFSIWIDTGESRILFDTGGGDALVRNAETLGIDLASADHLVLSHGHYDHTGGLASLDNSLPNGVAIHAHPGIVLERYSKHADGAVHAIGMPPAAHRSLKSRESDFNPTPGAASIGPGVWVSGSIPRITSFEDTGGDFWLDEACRRPDPVADDMALWVERPEGMWVFLGCAHAGVVNTIRHIQLLSGRDDVCAVIGGMHLRSASAERLRKTAQFLKGLTPEALLPCHCSGQQIHDALAETL